MTDKESNSVGFCGLLTLILITLKLLGKISWSWWWVWCPIWIPVLIIFIILVAVLAHSVLVEHY